ncbi:hypothetical protein ACFE04_021299 [Oxalis oulophora]
MPTKPKNPSHLDRSRYKSTSAVQTVSLLVVNPVAGPILLLSFVGMAVVTRNDGNFDLGRLEALCEHIKDLNTHGFEVMLTTSGVVAEGLTIQGILDNWSKIKPVILEAWSEKRDELIELFRNIEDEWMDSDLVSWIGANRSYPGASNVEVLKKLQKQPEHQGLNLQ